MKIIYRISNAGYNKVKPDYIDNEKCLQNFCNVFYDHIDDIHIIADNCSEPTINMINRYINPSNIEKVSIGHGAGTFNLALDKALNWEDDELVYFVENDYLHKPGSPDILKERLQKPIIQYDLKMNFIKEWSSQTEASQVLNINQPSISNCLKNLSKTSNGFIWKYKN